MFTTIKNKKHLRIQFSTFHYHQHRNYMVIKSKAAKRFQNITANKRIRQKRERLKSRYKEYYETIPIPTTFDARNPTQIPLRYLMTQKRNPLPKYIIKQIEICTNVRITALYKQSPSALLNLPKILQQIKKNEDENITSLHADILHKMILKSFLLPTNQQNKTKNATNQIARKQSEINMFIGSILFEGQRDDVKHALQLYNFIEGLRQECSIKIPGIPNHILFQLKLDNRRIFFSRKRSLSKFNDLFYDIKHTNCRRIKRFIDPAVTEQTKYISTMQSTKKRDVRLIGDRVTDAQIIQTNEVSNKQQQSVPSILTENRLQKLSKFVDTHLLSTKFTRQSDGTTEMVLFGSEASKQMVHQKINELAKSCYTLLVGDKKLPIILWQFPWLYWKVFTLTQSRAWEDFNKPGLLWIHGAEKWRTVKATTFLQTFLDNIDVIDINPAYYAAIVGHRGKMIEKLQSECGAKIFTYRHSKKRIEKNEQKEKETNEMMQRWKDRKIAKHKEYERRDKDVMSNEGIWKKWQQKTAKDPIKERESIEHQIEKLTNTRKWIVPKIEFDSEWQNKLMIFGNDESKNAVRKYVKDIVEQTVILPLSELQFRAIFHSMNYDKQKKEYLIKMEKRRKKMQKEYKNERLQIHFYDLDKDKKENEQNKNEEIVEPFLYRHEKLNHDALIKKMEREFECILSFDDENLYISNAQNAESVLAKLKKLYLRCVWRPFHGIKDLKMSEFDSNLYEINKAMAHNKQIKRFLINPLADNPNYAQIKAVFDKYCGLQYFWDNKRCELTLYGLREIVDAFAIDLQKYLQTFCFCKIDNLEQNNWLSIPHESIRQNVATIYKETGVGIFNLKKCEPILLSTNTQNLEIAKILLLDLLESVECIFVNPRQYELAQSVVEELEKKYDCDIIMNTEMNESKKEFEVNVIYHDAHLRDALIADFNHYLAQNELVCFDYNDYVSPLYANDFSFCSDFDQIILNPLSKYYDVRISMQQNEKNKIKVLGHSDNVQFANKALTRFCSNVRGMFFDQRSKGLLIYKYLTRYQDQFPSIYYWYDAKKQCLWSSVIPIAIRQQSEYKQHKQQQCANEEANVLMTDTATLQLQFDAFLNYLEHANKSIGCLYLGRHFSVLMDENLPFELDLIEYIKEEKEMNDFMDDVGDESKENNESETRMEMIARMSNADFEIDAENECIYVLGTKNQMNVAHDLIKDIFCNIGYIRTDEYCAQILGHEYFSTTHGDIEMSHQSLLSYISKECQVKLDLVQAYQHEIDLLNVSKWNEHMEKSADIINCDLLHLGNEKNLIFPDLYVVVYGNEMRQKLVREQLDSYLSSIELDTNSKMNTNKELAKMNRNQRRLLWQLFRIKRE